MLEFKKLSRLQSECEWAGCLSLPRYVQCPPLDREDLGDFKMEVAHIQSKHNKEMVSREAVHRSNDVRKGKIAGDCKLDD